MTTAAVPKQAATVLLLRDGVAGLEVYLLRRTKGMPFAGGMTAYPGRRGGRPRTATSRSPGPGRRPSSGRTAFGCDERIARELVCAAVRETFEEAGVLLAGPPAVGDDVVPDVSGDDWEEQRQALLRRDLSLSELLAGRGWRCARTWCGPFAHWITPPIEPRRYDTKFFVAALPVGQEARDVSGEADEAAWLTPAEALAETGGRDPADAAADDPHAGPAGAVPRRRRGAGRLAAGAAAPDQPDVRGRGRREAGPCCPTAPASGCVVPLPH